MLLLTYRNNRPGVFLKNPTFRASCKNSFLSPIFCKNLFIIIIFFTFAFFCDADELKLITGEFPPLTYTENGVPSGAAIEIINIIQKRLGTNYHIEFYPWARGYSIVTKTANSVLFSTTMTEDRKNIFKWVGPYAERRFILFARKGSKIKIENIEDAKNYTIGVMTASTNDDFLVNNNFKKIDRVNTETQNLKKLLAERIDLWFTDISQAYFVMEETGTKDKIVEIYTVEKNRSYFAFNIDTDDRIVNKWQETFEQIDREGLVLSILKKYGIEQLYPNKNR